MTNSSRNHDDHIGVLLSGYIDGELTQQERQRVDLHCRICEQCRQDRDELRSLRDRVGNATLSDFGEDKWRETIDDSGVRVSRGVGWLLLLGGLLAVGGVGIAAFLTDPDLAIPVKLIIGTVYGGAAALVVSVLRQRLIERKSDKYKDVEI